MLRETRAHSPKCPAQTPDGNTCRKRARTRFQLFYSGEAPIVSDRCDVHACEYREFLRSNREIVGAWIEYSL
jgi:hypothetical protein